MRKKSARLMEMEQSDPLEQQILHRQSRTNARKSRGSEHIVREIPASSLSDGNPVSPGFDKPVKVRFSLGVKQDEVDVTPKSRQRRDRRKLAAEVKMESDEELVVDEPTAVISPPSSEPSLVLRMKLNMDSSASFGSMDTQDSRHHSVCYFVYCYISYTPTFSVFRVPLCLRSSWCYVYVCVYIFLFTSFSLSFSELSMVGLALDLVD